MKRNQWLDELAQFIVEANSNTWAAEGAEVQPERKGYKELEYQRGEWRLRDSYTGYFRAPGMTTVYFKDKPVWTMAYGGTGQLEGYGGIVKPTFTFLKQALMQVSLQMPFRGPNEYSHDDWKYVFRLLRGDITDFLGEEDIFKKDKKVFTQTAMGGLVLSKDSARQIIYPWNCQRKPTTAGQ